MRTSTTTRLRAAARPRVAALTAAAVASLTLAACGGGSSSASESTLRFGLSAEPVTLTTGVWQGSATNFVLTLVHRGLMTLDESGELVPGLAESVETPDPTTYVFTLHEGLTFSDGSPLTAQNVKSSLEYYADPESGSTLIAGLQDIAEITADSDTQVTITLAAPNNAFLEYLAVPTAAIVPDASLNADTPNNVGAGPFVLEDSQAGVGMTLAKFDDYYDAEDVALEEIDVSYYADGDARANALVSGDVDMIDYVTWENFDRVGDTDGVELAAQPGPFQYVQFNTVEGPFADPLVREAVAHAINRDNALTAAFQSNGEPLYGVVMPEDPALEGVGDDLWSYDPDRAKELLAEAGYPDGFSATLLATSQYTFLQDTALSVQQDLQAIGIDVTLDAPDWSGRLEKGAAGDYDLAVSGDVGIVTNPSYLLGHVQGPDNFNRSFGYQNPEIAAALTDGLRATDDAARVAAYEEAFSIFATDVPFATIDTRDQAWAHSDDVEGFANLPGFHTFFSGYTLANTSIER
ncbi:hypothetical protein INN71_08850 [Nocardioides sp. ChNu-153]|uniref:ABC transporter substrate-binding protein n=1 Tax=unclassified Nocardioides TaxID=2615069 RepID=UPI002405E725|nr:MULTISPECIES: ABC transporter substrate-binding protein [unclassified Nocardioides]MDF9717069.1 hypothetical protein [Nocardioides sp. ChNu-99]MDN7121497.1 hypothetical protein [Nocardioides sp. ChNu-153]